MKVKSLAEPHAVKVFRYLYNERGSRFKIQFSIFFTLLVCIQLYSSPPLHLQKRTQSKGSCNNTIEDNYLGLFFNIIILTVCPDTFDDLIKTKIIFYFLSPSIFITLLSPPAPHIS